MIFSFCRLYVTKIFTSSHESLFVLPKTKRKIKRIKSIVNTYVVCKLFIVKIIFLNNFKYS